jgi:hypothetical protein
MPVEPLRPILSSGIRKRIMTALDRRAAQIFSDEFLRVMQGLLTEDGMIAGEAIHWDPNDPASTGGTTGGDLGGGLPTPTVTGIQGFPVTSTPPVAGQSFIFNGTTWVLGSSAASAHYIQYTWEADGAGDWGFTQEDDGTGQLVPTMELELLVP